MIVVELAGAPQGKGRPRFVRSTGHAYTPAETRRYETALRFAAEQVMGRNPPLDGPLNVVVEALFPIPESWSRRQWDRAIAGAILPTGRPDIDNVLKIAGDALNGVLWVDDKQIVSATIKKRYANKPSLIVMVTQEMAHGRLFDDTPVEAARLAHL